MATEQEILALFREMYLFRALTEAEMKEAASKFDEVSLRPGDRVFGQGEPGNAFYIILKGEVAVTRQVGEQVRQLDVLVAGDFFGEEALLTRRRRSASVSAVGPATLLKATEEDFVWLTAEIPQIKAALKRIMQTRDMVRSGKFSWLNDDEIVYQIRRKHWGALLLALWMPLIVLFFSLLAFGAAGLAASYGQMPFVYVSAAIGLLLLVVFLMWGGWAWIDWRNDYYIVTNQRAVWVEQVIFFYESQVEAPLGAIMAVDMNSTLLGRLIGYGNVIISTYTGKVIFQMIGDPHQMVHLIEEYWHRTQRQGKQMEAQELQNAMWKAMGKPDKVKTPAPAAAPAKPAPAGPAAPAQPAAAPAKKSEGPGGYEEPTVRSNYLGSIFQVRLERGNTITYRKHWLILMKKTLIPTLLGLGLFALVVGYIGLYFSTTSGLISPVWVVMLGLVLFFLVIFPWWLYNYIDWRNDIYQLTDKNIFDIERKPLGTEQRKSASLENILSLEHRRPGFLGYIFNYGPVIITVGDTKFTFDYVSQPARVQRDIFNRMNALRIQKQRTAAAAERERTMALLSVYHRNLEQWLKEDVIKDSQDR